MQKISKKHSPYIQSEWSGKPYNFFGDYLWATYNCRVLKLPINAYLNCPNRDGTLDTEGCVFCCEHGSASPTTIGHESVLSQMQSAKNNFRRSDTHTRYIAYFQAYTNTHASASELWKLYAEAVKPEYITGLMIGTRPDSLPDAALDVIAAYQKQNFELWLEIGMQSMHDASLRYLNRHHSYSDTKSAVIRAADRGIKVCVHIILGIPGETWQDMMATACEIASLPVHGVKLHHLHVIKNTRLADDYNRGHVPVLSLPEYVSTVCDFIERLRPDILIHRLSGDRNEETLVAPRWGMHKGTVIQSIEDEFKKRNTYQGFLYEG